ncbi:MAG: diguanylate cyclase [Chitinispirillia bacterium]|nr:diguanylate cyclase [Chitinispirillia bacterium]
MSERKKEYTILLVDDGKTNLDILSDVLSPLYNILVSKSGPKALELAEKHVPDLILLDVMMPEMSGFEVITKLKESDVTSRIPVIFITGLTASEDEEKGFFLGAVDYITKPFVKSIVKARVNTHIKIIDQMRTIERIALMDPLTKICNRRGFDKRFDAEWRKAISQKTPVSFMIIDADKFKSYNDTWGHPQGDLLLQTVAGVFKNAERDNADCAARWGGEEFVMLLPNTDIDGAAEVAEKVREQIAALVILTEDGTKTTVTVSIGVNSVIPDADTSIADFVSNADQALYKAKESGRNRVVKVMTHISQVKAD